MKIITRYLYRQFFIYFFLSLATFLIIYLVIEFFGKIDKFIEASVPLDITFLYFIYQSPFIILQLIPVSVVISVMLMLGLMNKHNEVLAMKCSGFSMYNISYTLMGISVMIGIGAFFLSESIVPVTSSVSNRIWNSNVEKKNNRGSYKLSHIWYRGKKSIYQIRTYDKKSKIIEGITIFFFNKDFTLNKRIDARKAQWKNSGWCLNDGLIQDLSINGGEKLKRFLTYNIQLPETPENFERSIKSPEEMSFWELRKYTRKIKEEGYDSSQYRVDLNIKIAFPFICPVLTLVGIPIALRRRKGGIPFSISIGVGISFLYLLALGLSRSLSVSGVLPPLLGAWMANLLFSLFGIYLLFAEDR